MPTATLQRGSAKKSGRMTVAIAAAVLAVIVMLGIHYAPDNDDCLYWEFVWKDNNGDYGGKEEFTVKEYEDALRIRDALDKQHRGWRRYYVKCGKWRDDDTLDEVK